jgi:hypothetical protein
VLKPDGGAALELPRLGLPSHRSSSRYLILLQIAGLDAARRQNVVAKRDAHTNLTMGACRDFQ